MRADGIEPSGEGIQRRLACAAMLAALWIASGAAQSGIDPVLLKRLFPAAASFSPKGGDPPHVKALTAEDRKSVV